jgi:CBS domain-containing protein
VTLGDLGKVPRQEWPREVVRTVMIPKEKLVMIGPDESAYSALNKMGTFNVGRLPVVENGQIIGLVTRQDLLNTLRVRTQVMKR